MWWSKKSDKKSGDEKNSPPKKTNEKSIDPFQQARDIEEQQPSWKKPRTRDPEKGGPAVDTNEVPPNSRVPSVPGSDFPSARRRSSTVEPHSRKQSFVPFYVEEQAALAELTKPEPVYSPNHEASPNPFADHGENDWAPGFSETIDPQVSRTAIIPAPQWGSTSTAVPTPTASEFTFGGAGTGAGSFDPHAHKEQLSAHRSVCSITQ